MPRTRSARQNDALRSLDREVDVARIAEAELQRLKTEVSVQRLAEARGVELKKHGADLVGRCPFHDDQTPSLVVSPACARRARSPTWCSRSRARSRFSARRRV
jgi:hypothetical protein